MNIFNIMLSRDLGGIQNVFVTYTKLLKCINGHRFHIISNSAQVSKELNLVIDKEPNDSCSILPNYSQYDIFSILKLRNLIKDEQPDIIIVHGNRAAVFAYYASRFLLKRPKIIGLAHNYSYKHLKKCDYVFCITKAMCSYMESMGIRKDSIFYLPNSIETTDFNYSIKTYETNIITIGIMARLVHKKGIDIALHALRILKEKALNLRLIIAGEGEELENLQKLSSELGLKSFVEFTGWIYEQEEFYSKIDIFCLPSRQEPFGIVVLESMIRGIPVVASNTDGPLEIISHNQDGLIVDKESPDQLAMALELLINNANIRASIGAKAITKIKKHYTVDVVSKLLQGYLEQILTYIK
ncbi:MAG: glycosyltransferase family 4 protein [Rickettsiaceae bacterium]|nr:glycosyltransferase family 4 protein [Rickettsiaceae bacterium]